MSPSQNKTNKKNCSRLLWWQHACLSSCPLSLSSFCISLPPLLCLLLPVLFHPHWQKTDVKGSLQNVKISVFFNLYLCFCSLLVLTSQGPMSCTPQQTPMATWKTPQVRTPFNVFPWKLSLLVPNYPLQWQRIARKCHRLGFHTATLDLLIT